MEQVVGLARFSLTDVAINSFVNDQTILIIAGLLGVLNLSAFLLMWWDKHKSQKNGAERIPEGLLFFWAAAFGSLGVWAGMVALRHKTRKWYFVVGVPLLVMQQGALLWLAYALQ